MLRQSIIRFVTATASGLILSLSLNQAQAAPACKGVDSKSQCSLNSSCTWVNGYTTKKGNKISSYCRKKGGSKKKSSSSKKTDTGKAKVVESKKAKSKPKKEKVKKEKVKKEQSKKNKGKKDKKAKKSKGKKSK